MNRVSPKDVAAVGAIIVAALTMLAGVAFMVTGASVLFYPKPPQVSCTASNQS